MNPELLAMMRALLAGETRPVPLNPELLRRALASYESTGRALEQCGQALEGMLELAEMVQKLVTCSHGNAVRIAGIDHCLACGAQNMAPGEPWLLPTAVAALVHGWHGTRDDSHDGRAAETHAGGA